MLNMLNLTKEHRQHHREVRGLTDEQIDKLQYRSTPPFYSSKKIARVLREKGCTLEGVPGFYMKDGLRSIYHNCFCYWWKTLEGGEIGFRTDGKFNSLITNTKVTFRGDAQNTEFLLVGEKGGTGSIENPFFNEAMAPDKSYRDYLVGRVL